MARTMTTRRLPQQIRFCRSRDGTRIAYAMCGSGPPLVCVKNWVGHLERDWDNPVWRPWLALLTQRHTLLRFDFRGCGLSDRERVAFSPARYEEDLEAVISAAGLDQFAFVGTGSGAALGMVFAARHPGRVHHLVLCGAQAQGRLARDGASPAKLEEAEARLKIIELGWAGEIPGYADFFASLHVPDATAEQFRAYNDLIRVTTTPANAVALLRSFWQLDVDNSVPLVRCPTLVLHARGDAVIPFEEGRRIATLIPDARFLPLASRNHVLLDSEPGWGVFAEALAEFVPATTPQGSRPVSIPGLSAREQDVIELVAQGLDNKSIGRQLGISARTARNHVSAIFGKLGVNSRPQAIVVAREAGYGHRSARERADSA
jgi:pimeloyl-ACP methyl ester carboxylesterase/DNA-binding CsgD family transcriptional regulator